MDLEQRILITGGHSAVAVDLKELLRSNGFNNIMSPDRKELDLTDSLAVNAFFHKWKPDVVLHIAARTTSAKESDSVPWDVFRDNFLIEYNIFEIAEKTNVKRLIWVSSDSALPYSNVATVQTESSLFQAPLRKEIEPYAFAKLAGIKMCEYINRQKKQICVSLLPCYIYGNVKKGLMCALVNDFITAKKRKDEEVRIWGKSTLQYRFIHSRDVASAILFVMNHQTRYDRYIIAPQNVISKAELTKIIAKCVGYQGKIVFDESDLILPAANASPAMINEEGWNTTVSLEAGVEELVNWLTRKH